MAARKMRAVAAQYWQLGEKRVELDRSRVMAIVNAAPDSFYASSVVEIGVEAELIRRIEALLAEGPHIVDVGGQSTRPGSERIGPAEELRRVLPVIAVLRELAPELPITVDTYHSAVAREALAAGADGVNDISAGRLDPELLEVVAHSGCGYVLMHMQGTPETMQARPHYEDCVAEVEAFLVDGLEGIASRGILREKVAIDPGIGFGKRLRDNVELLRAAPRLARLGHPLLYGVSRKRFIEAACADLPVATKPGNAEQRLPGTLGVTWQLLNDGVMLHRLHDVAAARQLFAVWEALQRG
jgi:dihydropteroate synthase